MEFREVSANPKHQTVVVILSPATARVRLTDVFKIGQDNLHNGEFTLTCGKSVIPESIAPWLQTARYTPEAFFYEYQAGQLKLERRKTIQLDDGVVYELLSASTAPNGLFTVQAKAPNGDTHSFANVSHFKMAEETFYRQVAVLPSPPLSSLEATITYDVRCSTHPVHHIYLHEKRIHSVMHVQNAEDELIRKVSQLSYCEHGPRYQRDRHRRESYSDESTSRALMAAPSSSSMSPEETEALLDLTTVPIPLKFDQETADVGNGVFALEPRVLPQALALSYQLAVSVPSDPTAAPRRPTPALTLPTTAMPMLGHTMLYGADKRFLTESTKQERTVDSITTQFQPYSDEVVLTVRTAFVDHDSELPTWPHCRLTVSGLITNHTASSIPEIKLLLPTTFYWAGDTCDVLPENRIILLPPSAPGVSSYEYTRAYIVRLPPSHHH